MFLPTLILLIAIAIIEMQCCYASTIEAAGLRRTLIDTVHATKRLHQTITGIVLWLARYNSVMVDPPNVFGAIVKIGIPEPTGAIMIYNRPPPKKGVMCFFANDIDKGIKTLIIELPLLSDDWNNNEKLNLCLADVRKDIHDLRLHDKSIQTLVDSPNYSPARSRLLIIREVLAMAEETDHLSALLKSTKKEINKESAIALTAANLNRNWR